MKVLKKVDTFSNRLKSLLSNRNLKQSDLAKQTNLSKQQISQYVNGKFEPKPMAVLSIAQVLDINEFWLMGYDVPMTNKVLDVNQLQQLENFDLVEDIERKYGDEAVGLLEGFAKLNTAGKSKILEFINDLAQIEKYITK